METTKKQKTFDAVKMMRDIRDSISFETQNMSFEELKAYVQKKLSENKTKLIGQPYASAPATSKPSSNQ